MIDVQVDSNRPFKNILAISKLISIKSFLNIEIVISFSSIDEKRLVQLFLLVNWNFRQKIVRKKSFRICEKWNFQLSIRCSEKKMQAKSSTHLNLFENEFGQSFLLSEPTQEIGSQHKIGLEERSMSFDNFTFFRRCHFVRNSFSCFFC